MDSNPGGLVMPHLLNWVSLHFPACEERARYVSSVRNMYLWSDFSPGQSCHRAATARSSMGTTGRRSASLSSRVALTRPEISSDFTQSSPCMDLFTMHGPVHLARRAAAQDAALQRRLLCNSIWIQFARLASWGESKSSVEKVFVELFLCRWLRDCRRGTLQPSLNWQLLLSCLLDKRKRSTLLQNAVKPGTSGWWHVCSTHCPLWRPMSWGYTALRQSSRQVWRPWQYDHPGPCWRPWKQTFHSWWGSSVSAWTTSGSLLTCSTCYIMRAL